MLLNYLEFIYKQLVCDRIYSAIAITGLTLGMICCYYSGIYLRHEFELSGVNGSLVALVTMSYHGLHGALNNPIEGLRNG